MTRRVVAFAPFVVSVAVLVGVVVLEAVRPVQEVGSGVAPDPGAWTALQGTILTGAAALLLRRGGVRELGWAMAAFGLFWTADSVAESYIRVGLTADDAWPGMTFAVWFYARFASLLTPTLILLLLVYPTGRFLPGRWRVASWVAMALQVGACLVFLTLPFATFDPDFVAPQGLETDPTTITTAEPMVLAGLARTALMSSFLVPLAIVFVRHRRARGVERDQMRWLLWGVLVTAVGLGTITAFGIDAWPVLAVLLIVPFVAMAVAIVNPTLVRIDELLSRTVVFVVLSVSVVVVDLLALAAITRALDDRLADRQVLTVVLLLSVLVYNPLRVQLLGWVRRLVLGERDRPYDAVAGLAATLESTAGTEAQLAAVADAVAGAFGVSFVRVEVDRPHGERLEVVVGEQPDQTRTLPITFRDAEVGRLVLPAAGVRAPLGRTDDRLLGDLVRQAASAAVTTQLAAELQDDRERLVTAREEELRRIRRDLHDGLGPALGGAVFQLESARLLVAASPDRALAQLAATKAHLQDVVVDVRRLVHDLRPPALDDLGLVGAVRQVARDDGLVTTVEAIDDLTGLPAAVEVAAYRIVGEALTNVRRHAAATRCTVQLELDDDALVVEVSDDGDGMSPDAQAGIGLLSLRERAAELGGVTEVTCPPGGGTVVRARLPLAPTPAPTNQGALA